MGAKKSIYEILKEHEGVVNHQYLDTEGYVTAGVGFLIPDRSSVDTYYWDDLSQARKDWTALTKLGYTGAAPKSASNYLPWARAKLLDVDTPLVRKVTEIERVLGRMGFPLAGLPWQAYQVCVDLAYQVGTSGLVNGFPSFVKAIRARDWARAAAECRVKQASAARNNWRRTTLLQLTTQAEIKSCPTCGQSVETKESK